MKKNFIFFLACWLLATAAYGQVALSEPFGSGGLPMGWTSAQVSGDGWRFTGNPGWGVSNTPDHTPGGSTNYAWLDFSGGAGNDSSAVLTTPGVDISTLSSPILSFAYESYYSGTDTSFVFNTLTVQAWNGTAWATMATLQGNTPQGWEVLNYAFTPAFTYAGGDSVRVRFIADSGNDPNDYENDLLIDDVMIMRQPTCFAPNNLAVSNIQATTADLTWMPSTGMPPAWEVAYGAPNTPPGSAGRMVVATLSANLMGLMPNSDYTVYVRAICAPGDTSAWSSAAAFSTTCGAASPVYNYPFNDFINNDPCWSEATGVLLPGPTVLTGITSAWAEDGFGNVGTQDAAKMNLYSSRAEWLISESIDLGVGTPYQLEFDIALTHLGNTSATTMDGDDTIAVVISIDNGATWSAANVLQMWTAGMEPSNTGDHIIIDLTAYSGVVKFGFYGRSVATNPANNDLFIDNILIRPLVSCNSPSALTATNITDNSASIGWTNSSPAALWQIEYGVTGFTPGTGMIATASTNPFNLTGLTDDTDYDFYVRAICTPGDTSAWSAMGTFATLCTPFIAPFVERFPTASLPLCWIAGGATPWEYGSGATTPTGFAAYGAANLPDHSPGGGGTFIGMDGSDNGNGEVSTLLTPRIDVSGLTNGEMSFWYFSNNTNDAAQNQFIIDFYDGAAWSNLDTIQNNAPGWRRYGRPLSNFTITGPVQIRFTVVGVSNGGFTFHNDILIDDVVVDEIPACLPPSNLNAINVTPNSADLAWMSGASNWEVEYGPSGFALGTGMMMTTTNNPLNITGLMPGSGYTFFVRSICAPGDTSAWAGPFSFTTPCPAAYTPPYLQTFDQYPATCWTEAQGRIGTTLTGTTSAWNGGNVGNVAGPGRESAKLNLWSSGHDEWLISPSIDLGTGAMSYQLEFDIAMTTYNGTVADTFDLDDTISIVISTDNGATWAPANALRSWTRGSEPSVAGDHIILNLAGYTGVVKFGFYGASSTFDGDNDIFVDNFEVKMLPAPADLVINEIMYNGPESSTDTSEFIEIYNNGSTPVNLNNFSMVGVVYTFPNVSLAPGAFYVIAFDTTAFFNIYGVSADDQWTSGGLSNGGETIILLDAAGMTLDSVRYDDAAPWPAGFNLGEPDGGGSSLVLCDPNTDNADGANWGVSNNLAGVNANLDPYFATPGAANTCAPPNTDVEADQFLNLNTVYCGATSISGGFVVSNVSGVDANNVTYTITANGFPISSGSIPLLAANSSDTISVGPVPVTTGSATLVAIVNVSNDNNASNDTLSQVVYVSNTAVTITVSNTISCNGGMDGAMIATGSNGIGMYTYNWSTGDTTDAISMLGAGTYIVTVTDSVGCMTMDSVVLTEPMALSLMDSVDNVGCNGDSTGMVDVTVMGGTAPYTYMWSNGGMMSMATNLPAGSYGLTVTDANGCMVMGMYTVTEPAALTVVIQDNADGTATANASGGTTPYAYQWDVAAGSQTTMMATGLTNANTYSVTVTDANGCMAMDTVTIRIISVTTLNGEETISIFPNPANDQVFIDLDLTEEQPVQVELYNAVGQRVLAKALGNVQTTRVELPTAQLPTGVYLVHLTVGEARTTRRLVVNRP